METYSIRLLPGQDLKRQIDELVRREEWGAACIITGIGSLSTAAIRFAGKDSAETIEGPFEIISLAGTVSRDGSHIHILVSDSDGVPTAGHLKEGAIIRTTAEIVLGALDGWRFNRKIDPATECSELSVERLEE